jgi:LAO/AO transport system kinase
VGGLARATRDVIRVLDASGKDVVVVETVGVGQDEVDIASQALTTLLVNVPGLGDDIQAIKAGILEIADLMVLNKADREGANELLAQLRHNLSFSHPEPGEWRVPIQKTVAVTGEGIPELVDTIDRHRDHLRASGELQTRLRASLQDELVTLVQEAVGRRARTSLSTPECAELLERVLTRESDPFTAASRLLSEVCPR